MNDMNPLGLKPDSIVYCTKTNSVLYARDALFDADWKAYRHEEFPAGEPFFVVPAADEPAGEDYPNARHNGRRHNGNRGR